MSHKHCKKCDSAKPVADFSKNKSAKDGLAYWCRACCSATHKSWRERNGEARAQYQSNWYQTNKDHCRTQNREWREQNRETDLASKREYYDQNREQFAQWRRSWKQRNRRKYNAYHLARRKRTKLATPPWADLRAIQMFYENCPTGFHVDHIVPLNGENVCGLHVIENLQYLPAVENIKKGNRYAGT